MKITSISQSLDDLDFMIGKKAIDLPVKDVEIGDLVRNGQHHLCRVHAQFHAFLPVVLRDPTVRLAACPGEVNHQYGLVVLAKDGQSNVAHLMVVQNQVHVLLMYLLQGSREVAPPALQELVRRLQALLALCW